MSFYILILFTKTHKLDIPLDSPIDHAQHWDPLLPYWYSYKASCAFQTGLSRHL